jgi:hypothetical protein
LSDAAAGVIRYFIFLTNIIFSPEYFLQEKDYKDF